MQFIKNFNEITYHGMQCIHNHICNVYMNHQRNMNKNDNNNESYHDNNNDE